MTQPDTSFGTRKRNNKCRNKICACDGSCLVDDGTGDFAKPTDPRIGLERLRSRMLGWEDCDHEIGSLKKALEEIMGICGDWKKWKNGKKWYWDCDTPDTVRKAYEIAEKALEATDEHA